MRRAALLLLGAALALLLAACGGGPALAGVAQAAAKTEQAGSARFSLSFESAGTSFGAQGAVDYENRRAQMTLDLGSLGALLGQGDQQTGSLEMLLDDTVLYMRFPVLAGGGSGKPWLKMDLENLSRQAGTPLEQFGQLSQGDPTQTLKYLRAAGDFEALGSDRVRGIETTHYKGTIDLRKVLGEVDGPQQEQLERLLDQSGVSTVPAEAWIDGEGYLRKLTALGLTMELYDFGAPVALDLPSEDEVTDLTELAGTGS